jgi:hypothetical protein
VYVTEEESMTLVYIAESLGVEVAQLVCLNRPAYPSINANSKLKVRYGLYYA